MFLIMRQVNAVSVKDDDHRRLPCALCVHFFSHLTQEAALYGANAVLSQTWRKNYRQMRAA